LSLRSLQNMFMSNICKIITALVVSSLVLPASLASTFVFAVIYVRIFRSFLLLSRDANRIASTTASPLFASFGEALRGIVTIRAFGKQHEYRSRLCHIVDETLAFWYLTATLDVRRSLRHD
jgi:ABC-type transport system involved in cytochrome bd biosynthesis fused ATPase/permease subunit